MIASLKGLQGNSKICVLTEPLWGIPYNLYAPFASVYMLALGATDVQVGVIASLSLLVRAIVAMLSGAITDKLGRRRATVIFDTLSWSMPCLVWACAQNVWWFYVAAALNGLWQITENSWTCLLVEDAEKSKMVNIYNWIYLAGQLAVFFAPLAGILVGELTIVPAMRILYGFSFVSMTAKFALLYIYGDETKVGRVRLEETRGMSLFSVLKEYKELIPRFFRSGSMVTATGISILFSVISMVMSNFFGIYTTKTLGVPDQFLAYFPIIRSVILLIFIFFIQSRLTRFGFKIPMLIGVVIYALSHLSLIFLSGSGLIAPVLYTFLEACAHALVMPRKDSFVALSLDPQERARMSSIMTVMMLGITIPFGAIAGVLSDANRIFPFVLNLVLLGVSFLVIASSSRLSKEVIAEQE